MSAAALFLAWQDRKSSRQWFPIGRLDADAENSDYRFRYIGGAKRAAKGANFRPLVGFPDMDWDYRSDELFPIFQNRVLSPKRPDFVEYLRTLDLSDDADPIEILSANEGRRLTDTFEVFPELVKNDDGSFVCRFFLHGWRHVSESAQVRLERLEPGETLHLALELTNPRTTVAVQIQTTDYQMIGWAPRYLVDDLTKAMAESPGEYAASVVRVNPQPAPSSQRVLVELSGRWEQHEPMSGSDYKPLVD